MMRRTAYIFFTLCVLASVSIYADPASAQPKSYFDMTMTRSENLKPFPKWNGMRERFSEQQKIPDDQCGLVKYHPCVIKDWVKLIESLKEKALGEQIDSVNSWANAHPYIVDQLNWGMEDFWETPYEFMEISGDCEDYAIAKYYSLRALGVAEEKIRIIIVQDFNLGGIVHAVLGIDTDKGMMILDNQIDQVRPALSIYHYRPIYAINEMAWWAYNPKG